MKLNFTRWQKYTVFWQLALAVFLFDQITKWLVIALIPWEPGQPTYALPGDYGYNPEFEPICIVDNFFYFVHIDNPGAAWSLFAGHQILLSLFAFAALAGIFFFRRHLELERLPSQIALGLLAGGIAGNLFDRLVHNHVIDFLDVHLPLYGRWPAFNVADCGIVIGVIFYLFINIIPLFGYNHPRSKRFNEEETLNK